MLLTNEIEESEILTTIYKTYLDLVNHNSIVILQDENFIWKIKDYKNNFSIYISKFRNSSESYIILERESGYIWSRLHDNLYYELYDYTSNKIKDLQENNYLRIKEDVMNIYNECLNIKIEKIF